MGKHIQSIDSQVQARIRDKGAGTVFRAADFFDIGCRSAIDQALSRQSRAGTIRRIARGLYDLPTDQPLLGRLGAPSDAVAKARASRDLTCIQAISPTPTRPNSSRIWPRPRLDRRHHAKSGASGGGSCSGQLHQALWRRPVTLRLR